MFKQEKQKAIIITFDWTRTGLINCARIGKHLDQKWTKTGQKVKSA